MKKQTANTDCTIRVTHLLIVAGSFFTIHHKALHIRQNLKTMCGRNNKRNFYTTTTWKESAIQKRTRSGKKVNDMIGKITVQEAAAVLHVSQQFVRIGMQERVLPIGTALKMSSKWTYNITEGKLAEYAGVDLEEEIARIRGEGITA